MFEQGVAMLRNLGFEVTYHDVSRKWRYLAGTDEDRAAQLSRALEDAGCKAIFFARGGYGSCRIIPALIAQYPPKILLGCSDITSLHLFFQSLHRWVVFHGPMPSGDMARGQFHRESFEQALMLATPYELKPAGIEVLQAEDEPLEGLLLGGCLTLMDAAIGTRWEPQMENCILFLEDVSVKPYQVDRMLTHLKQMGRLDLVQAFIFGEMKDCVQTENQGYTIQEVIMDVLGVLGKPIYFNFPSGHVSGPNWTLPLGVRARVSSDPEFKLEILESPVT
jgi:muramoyltetrapeptide carboxypeptidase